MKFIDAFTELVKGKKIHRKNHDEMYISLTSKMENFSGKLGFVFSVEDFLADDWEIEVI